MNMQVQELNNLSRTDATYLIDQKLDVHNLKANSIYIPRVIK